MLEVNEIFGPTIQGEGKLVGNPSVFVRFGNCNMSCSGFKVQYETPSGLKRFSCDSFYASDSAFKEQWDRYETSKPLIEKVNQLLPSYKLDIVITGGEPLLYWRDVEFQKFLHYYIKMGYKITIETNGSIDINLDKVWHKEILFSMSVKLSNSAESLNKRVNIKTLTNIINLNSQSYLKFVVGKDFLQSASKEIDDILNQIPKCEVYLMPMGDSAKAIDDNSLSIINLCLEKGFKYSDRLHIRVWNNKRGV
jgi:organic radical activating enzyme